MNVNDSIIVLTGKTNGYVPMKFENYKLEMKENLDGLENTIGANEISKERNLLIEKLKDLELILGKDEFSGVKHRIESCAMPTPRLLAKDYKKPNDRGLYSSRLVVLAESFISRFSELGCKITQDTLRKSNMQINRFTIVQASSFKSNLEDLNVMKGNNSIIKIKLNYIIT